MTVLLTPVLSSSFRSWKVICGGLNQQLCVQERTDRGIEKNKRLGHRLMYRKTDLVRYRIIYSCNSIDYKSELVKLSIGHNFRNKSSRMVLAVSNNLQNIMRDWENITSAWRKHTPNANGVGLNTEQRNMIYEHIIDDKMSLTEIQPKANGKKAIAAREDFPIFISSSELSLEERPEQLQRPLDAYDMCLSRIVSLLHWHRPIETLVYVFVLILVGRIGLQRWPLFSLVTLCAGFPWFRQPMDRKELEKCTQTLSWLEKLFSWRSSRHVVSFIIALVLVEYVTMLLLPHLHLLEVLEWTVPTVLVVFLFHAGLLRLLNASIPQWHFPVTERPANAETISPQELNDIGADENVKEPIGEERADAEPLLPLPLPNAHDNALREEIEQEEAFSEIVTRTIEFASKSNGWLMREKQRDGLVIWEKQSSYSNKTAILITANIPHANAGTLQHLLLDDLNFEDKKTSYAYQYDKYLTSRTLIKALGKNEIIILTRYKAVQWGIAPREVLSHVSCANLFTPAQQEALGLRCFDCIDTEGKELWAFAQCAINCSDSTVQLPSSLVSHQYQRAEAHNYFIMGLEETDGSLSFHLCMDVDPGGKLPTALQRKANMQHITKAVSMVKLLTEIGPKPNIVRPYVNSKEFEPMLCRPTSLGCAAPTVKSTTVEGNITPSFDAGKEIKRIATRFVQELLLSDWKQSSEKDGISLWTTTTPWTDKKAVKTVVFIPGVTLDDVDAITSNMSLAPKLDKTIESKKEVRAISDTLKVYHTTFYSPMWGVNPRDMVTREALSYYPDPADCIAMGLLCAEGVAERRVLLHVAEDATEEVPTTSNYQRGQVFLAGLFAEEIDDENGVRGVRLVYCVAADPGGSIPKVIIDGAIILHLKNMTNFVAYVKQRAETGNRVV